MGLKDLLKSHGKTKDEKRCPVCGTEGVETDRLEIKCPAPPNECEVIVWYPSWD